MGRAKFKLKNNCQFTTTAANTTNTNDNLQLLYSFTFYIVYFNLVVINESCICTLLDSEQ